MKRRVTMGAVLMALVISGCGGGKEETTTSPAPSDGVEAPSPNALPPSAAGQLPPEFLECMADRGYEIKSPGEIHSAPPQVLQACFGSVH